MTVLPVAADHDYPQMIAETNHVEPAPRRVRATLGGEQIFDTTRARYVWEWPYYCGSRCSPSRCCAACPR